MNPYTPPTSELSAAPQLPRVSLNNPARFVLYPAFMLCMLFFGVTSQNILRSSFRFRPVDFLNAGGTLVIGGLGVWAFYLAARKLSRHTRTGTMLWSGTTIALLLVSMYFEPPRAIHDFNAYLATGIVLLSVGILAYRSDPG